MLLLLRKNSSWQFSDRFLYKLVAAKQIIASFVILATELYFLQEFYSPSWLIFWLAISYGIIRPPLLWAAISMISAVTTIWIVLAVYLNWFTLSTQTILWTVFFHYFSIGLALFILFYYQRIKFVKQQALDTERKQGSKKGHHVGEYELVRKLGEGGMGVVWEAKHRMLIRPAAIKIIRSSFLEADEDVQNEVVERFKREAQSTSQLHSAHTIRIYDFGTTDNGNFYYVMELLEGYDLFSLVARFGALPASRVTYLLLQICDSLMDAHAEGIVHRDIKPDNIFLCRYGYRYDFVKLLDFGMVKNLRADVSITRSGCIQGSPSYISPEMITDQKVDARGDIYSLGCVAYWMLTGENVFSDSQSDMELLLSHVKEDPIPPSEKTFNLIPRKLENIVMSCLAKKPENRIQNAYDLYCFLSELTFPRPWTQKAAKDWWLENSVDHQMSLFSNQ